MFKKIKARYSTSPSEECGTKQLKIKKCQSIADCSKKIDNSGIIMCKTNREFCGSAIKLLLDNLVSPEDVTNILETEANLRSSYDDREAECEFCNKKWDRCRVCCPNKEQQMYLLNEALQKLNNVPVLDKDFFESQESVPNVFNKNLWTVKEEKDSCSIEDLKKMEIMQKIKNKMKNMKKYYPHVFSHKGSIVEHYGTGAITDNVKLEILEFEQDGSSVFWV